MAEREQQLALHEELSQEQAMQAGQEQLVCDREQAMTQMEQDLQQRLLSLQMREELIQIREKVLGETEHVRLTLEQHVQRLRQANEQLVISAIQAQIMSEQIHHANEVMGHMARHDFLTNLPNRMLLMERLEAGISMAARQGGKLAVLFIDLDRFKVINDSLGHAMGDLVLQMVAQRLLSVLRNSDTACRQGGDEFVLLLPDIEDEHDVSEVGDKVCQTIAAPYELPGQQVHIGVTIGISVYPDDGDDAATLIRNADVAMYDAKQSGRGCYHFYRPELNLRVVERQRTETDLHHALEHGEFFLCYQPKVNLDSGRIIGAEALLRWDHPRMGVLAPARFIPVAESCGLIVPIGDWVMRAACQQARRWRDAGLQPGSMAVNISALEFRCADFIPNLRRILSTTGLPAACLELEITEGVLMEDAEASAAILHQLKSLGVSLAVDDFGTGYSSLSYLNQFPIDVLKIDQSFVRGVEADPGKGAIVDAVIAMGASLGQRVIAEGVESEAQRGFLRARHCAEGQGYLFGQPLAPDDFVALLGGNPGPGTPC
ncbi:EAL domain-containing protein [Oxalobacteraceae bacterium]|nr:EAL domain-containing protein [Oxalobacteraceae bacterium]